MAMEEKKVYVKDARNGKGAFARKKILPEKMILEIKGVFLTCNEDDDIDEETRNNTFRYDDDLYISPGKDIANFINHSCEPNAKVVKKNKKLFIYSILPILKDEEVLFDYSTILARDDVWEMECNCGSQKCRKVVKQFKKLPLKLKEKYIKEEIVPDFILKI
ncbi:MAG: uncharacterized protein QG585_104 [Patescibacteria group bacterium]|jgi:SET domain-containing protein|nr:uncharacterized protein [Patescibacteria group bacterium]